MPPPTILAVALCTRRDARSQVVAAIEAGIPRPTLSRIERGTHRPNYGTAKALAAWLGWTTDQVMEAATIPAGEGNA